LQPAGYVFLWRVSSGKDKQVSGSNAGQIILLKGIKSYPKPQQIFISGVIQ
jgi:hypothetical protein